MIFPTRSTLEAMEPAFPADLIPGAALEGARAIAGRWPDAFSSFYFECRLDPDDDQVDFLAAIAADRGGRRALDRWEPGDALEADFRGIGHFLEAWRGPRSAFFAGIPFVWFEFDDVGRPGPSDPSFSFCREPAYFSRHWSDGKASGGETGDLEAPTMAAVEMVYGSRLEPGVRESLLRCHRALPEGGRLIHLSAMLGRKPSRLKPYLSVPKRELFGYLERIGWPGDLPALRERLGGFLEPIAGSVFLDLTLGDGVEERIGFAFSAFQQPSLRRPDPAWDFLLDRLQAEGACGAAKRAALREWPGTHTPFPDRGFRLRRWADVKLIHRPGAPWSVKAYLGFEPVNPTAFGRSL